MKIKHRQMGFEVKSLDKSGSFAGYGSVFGNTDAYRDVVMPGAFANSLAVWMQKNAFPPILWQHDSTLPLGPFTAMTEDAKGLRVEGQLLVGSVQKAAEAYALLDAGVIRGLSIGYDVVQAEYDSNTNVNRLIELDLWECSIVTFPANVEAVVQSVKSIEAASFDQIALLFRELFPQTPKRLARKLAAACMDQIENPDSTANDDAEIAAILDSHISTYPKT